MTQDAKPSAPDLTFSTAYIVNRNNVVILSEVDDVAADGHVHTKVLFYRNNSWSNHVVGWPALKAWGQGLPSPELMILGLDGEMLNGTPAGFGEGSIDTSQYRPELIGNLRDFRQVGKSLVAVGMLRQAYLHYHGGWARIDAAVRSSSGTISGFNAADGHSEQEIYAVGFDGEIWLFDGSLWKQLVSPTNVTLHDIHLSSNGRAYACGNDGVVLSGLSQRFDVIFQDETEENIFSVVEFAEYIYFATLNGIYRMRDGLFEFVNMGLGENVSTGFLHASDGVMWSVGAKHIAVTEDGKAWAQIYVT